MSETILTKLYSLFGGGSVSYSVSTTDPLDVQLRVKVNQGDPDERSVLLLPIQSLQLLRILEQERSTLEQLALGKEVTTQEAEESLF